MIEQIDAVLRDHDRLTIGIKIDKLMDSAAPGYSCSGKNCDCVIDLIEKFDLFKVLYVNSPVNERALEVDEIQSIARTRYGFSQGDASRQVGEAPKLTPSAFIEIVFGPDEDF